MPTMSAPVRAAFARYPAAKQPRLEALRARIYEVAAELDLELDESLKWGEPSYAPRRPRTGTAVRLHAAPKHPGTVGLYVNCQTRLVDELAARHPGVRRDGRRGLLLGDDEPVPTEVVREFVARALTYKLRRR